MAVRILFVVKIELKKGFFCIKNEDIVAKELDFTKQEGKLFQNEFVTCEFM